MQLLLQGLQQKVGQAKKINVPMVGVESKSLVGTPNTQITSLPLGAPPKIDMYGQISRPSSDINKIGPVIQKIPTLPL